MKKYSFVFDNKCAFCNRGVKTLQSIGVVDLTQGIELDQFQSNKLACNVDPGRACDEMAVINNESLEVSYGYDGYVNLLGVRYHRIAKLLSNSLVKLCLNPVYLFIASNRRVIAPVQPSSSTCSPKLKKSYRFVFFVLVAFIAGVVTYIKGSLLSSYELFKFLSGWKLIIITASGWLLTSMLYQKPNKWEYWGHLAMIVAVATLIQVFGLFGYFIFPNILWITCFLLISDLVMLWMHYLRINILGVNQSQTLIWWMVLHSTAVFLTFFFVQNQY